MNEDEVSELKSEDRILRPPDEREVNRIKPKLTLKVQPVYMDPKPDKGRQPNKALTNSLCLKIIGRVQLQHDSNELKIFMRDKQMEATQVQWEARRLEERQILPVGGWWAAVLR